MRIGLVRRELRREVRAFMVWPRRAGLALLALGGTLVVWPRVTGDWPMLGSLPLQWLGWALVALAWAIFAVVIVRRSAFYRRRLAELAAEGGAGEG